jgi:catechol 2,3-dioxygenase-like lactoylglutathione lyase family enzyme
MGLVLHCVPMQLGYTILCVPDLPPTRKFYDALLGTLGIKPGVNVHNGIVGRYFYRTPTGSFAIARRTTG